MAQHWQRSSAARDYSLGHVDRLSDREIVDVLALWRWGTKGAQTCPSCGLVTDHKWRTRRNVWRCRSCEAEFSVTSGTIFAGHRIPLRTILKGFVLFANSAHSISADELMKHLGITQKTAWIFRGKLREALSATRPTFKLSGTIEADGMYLCGKPHKGNKRKKKDVDHIQEKIKNGKLAKKKLTKQEFLNIKKRQNRRVMISLRQIGGGKNQASHQGYAFITESENEIDATAIIRSYVEPGSIIMTDECPAYNSLVSYGYDHQSVQHSLEFCSSDGVNDNQCESFNSRLRRAEYGVFHSLRPQYLQSIADEFVWREDTRHLTNLERIGGLVHRVLSAGLSKFRGYYQRKDKRGKELRWLSLSKPIDGKFGVVGVVATS
ncbi:IS1595 family transposase [Duganella sp. FT50W]|uniref:IS1595 family transposase n=1 Tax=Duganella lactea TaxID=2692173 RepID=A0A6L8MI86_9BURK|nr:IS1595 family transposase [Duganella lactea]MYM82633.1 IS1595 family transposase [Duganella lactea]